MASLQYNQGKNVLIIGAGVSAADLVLILSDIAEKITISQDEKSTESEQPSLKINLETLPMAIEHNVRRILLDGSVEFIDDSKQHFTAIIYATGTINWKTLSS